MADISQILRRAAPAILLASLATLSGCGSTSDGAVSEQLLLEAGEDAANWLSHGRTYNEERFSPLEQINADNVGELGLAWEAPLGSFRGIEATPIVVDGVMYTTGSWSEVIALNAATGEVLWKYDPEVPREKGRHACCDVVNRGVAVYQDKLFFGTIDGRLIALDQKSGDQVWETRTFPIEEPHTITGAPRVVKGRVIIGNGGAEFGVRGFVAAYDAETGEQEWKFHTVPGNPKDGFENEAMEMAAETWKGEWWELGGGGTVWDSMAYDPELDLLYIGVGNGAPWNQKVRSPGGGDNLFLSSIVALRPDSGEYVWHYQTTPGETWDFTATQSIILADLEIGGEARKVLMQAPKNGFFYVIDRTDGKLISAENFVPVTWAKGIDPETGRPIENPEARYPEGMALVKPTPFGAHNWHPMSYSPQSGLVYIPTQDMPFLYRDQIEGDIARVDRDGLNTGVSLTDPLPDTEAERRALMKQMIRAQLVAWDPVAQKEVWRVEHERIWNGGTLATGGNLVFQGTTKGIFNAFNAKTGDTLWSFTVGAAMVGGPVSYEVDGEQYIAVSVGWGSGANLLAGYYVDPKGGKVEGRVIAFKLGADGKISLRQPAKSELPRPARRPSSTEAVARGTDLYGRFCGICHGGAAISAGTTPDLRYSATLGNDAFHAFVLEGAAAANGMPNFNGRLSKEEVSDIEDFLLSRAWLAFEDTSTTETD